LQLYRDIVITDLLDNRNLTLDQRESVAVSMHHTRASQERIYDRRTASVKAKAGGILAAKLTQEARDMCSSDEASSCE
jgi:hypothetical protein